MLTTCEKYEGEQAKVREKKQQSHCARANGSRTKVVQDQSSTPCNVAALRTRVGLRNTTRERSPLTNAMPRVKASASPRLHVETIYGHTQRTELEVRRESNLPVGQGCPSLPERCLEGYQYKNSMHLEHDEMQCKTEVTNTLRPNFEAKISLKIVQNPAPRGPNGLQNPFWKHPGRPS